MHKRLKKSIKVSFFIFIFLSILYLLGVFSNLQLKLSDNLYGGKEALDNIYIIAIDDKSINELGRWPWNRDFFAEMINFLEGTDVIGIDIAFSETSQNDRNFILAVSKAKNVVLASQFLSFENINGEIKGKELSVPITGRSAYVNMITDVDGTTRSVNMNLSKKENSFAYEIFRLSQQKKAQVSDNFLINFIGDSFTKFSFVGILISLNYLLLHNAFVARKWLSTM